MAGETFVRCPQLDPPASGSRELGALQVNIEGRALRVTAPGAMRVVAFTGPVGEAMSASDLAHLRGSGAQLALYLGGLGDTAEVARKNVTQLASLPFPTLFIAGGEDRAPVLAAAFSELDDRARDRVIHASGLRTVQLNALQLTIVAGAALGRYARDEQACGFSQEDLADIASSTGNRPTWLLSWQAPASQGATIGYGGVDVGSPELAAAFTLQGAVSAFPEVVAGLPPSVAHAMVVPRLARTGTVRGDGSRLAAALTVLAVTPDGLVPTP